jgi:predicted nucleotidyltransferase
MEKLKIPIPEEQLAEFCNRWQIEELAFFGSVLRNDFNPKSDIDVLISSTPDANWSLFDHIQMEQELSDLLNRKIDLYTRRAVEKNHNWLRREEILRTAEVILHGA